MVEDHNGPLRLSLRPPRSERKVKLLGTSVCEGHDTGILFVCQSQGRVNLRRHIRMTSNPYKEILTPAEAMRAIYIDFEGRKDEPPVLMGSLYYEGRVKSDPGRLIFRHDILDRTLQPLAGQIHVSGLHRYECHVKTLPQAMQDLARRVKNQKRSIVAWSQHEIQRIDEAELSAYLDRIIKEWFRDGKETARRWRTSHHPDWKLTRDESGRTHRLTSYLERIGYEVPEQYAGGRVGETIKQLRCSLAVGRDWNTLSPLRREHWTNLLMHNFHDCNGLREVVQRAAGDLDELKAAG